MRGVFSFLTACAVIGLGYWAYHQNIQTQHSIRDVERLQRAISVERERLRGARAPFGFACGMGLSQPP